MNNNNQCQNLERFRCQTSVSFRKVLDPRSFKTSLRTKMGLIQIDDVFIFRPNFTWETKIFIKRVFFTNLPRINFIETKFNFMGVTHSIRLTKI